MEGNEQWGPTKITTGTSTISFRIWSNNSQVHRQEGLSKVGELDITTTRLDETETEIGTLMGSLMKCQHSSMQQ